MPSSNPSLRFPVNPLQYLSFFLSLSCRCSYSDGVIFFTYLSTTCAFFCTSTRHENVKFYSISTQAQGFVQKFFPSIFCPIGQRSHDLCFLHSSLNTAIASFICFFCSSFMIYSSTQQLLNGYSTARLSASYSPRPCGF